jgi:hypothetical protein
VNRFGEDVDRALLLLISKYQDLWMVIGGYQVFLVFLVAQAVAEISGQIFRAK